MGRQITNEEFLEKNAEYFNINDLTPLEEYKKARQKMLFKHNKCGFQFYGLPQEIINNTLRCPICSNKSHKKTSQEFKQFIEMKYSNIIVQSDFVNSKTSVELYCKDCKNTWSAKPSGFAHDKKKKYCPFCSKQKIGPPPDYMNSIWASEYKDYASQFLDEETQKTIMPFSKHKVLVTCPNCGNKKLISLNHLFRDGIRCFCEDGISQPNKVMHSILQQLNVEYISEFNDVWCENRKYDFYIPSLNTIIEMNGKQHYVQPVGNFAKSGRMLEDQQKIDAIKKDMALAHGIKNYFEIDCRNSDIGFIKNNIINSGLLEILNAKDIDINWIQCLKDKTKNFIKAASELYNNGASDKEISKQLHICVAMVYRYLKQANLFGWCNYAPDNKVRWKDRQRIGQ